MGDIADAIVNGECCDLCHNYLELEAGHPARCVECGGEHDLASEYDNEEKEQKEYERD